MFQEAKFALAANCDLFDHFVGAGEQRGRDREAEQSCDLVVNDQLKPALLHDRQVLWLGTFKDTTGVNASPTKDGCGESHGMQF